MSFREAHGTCAAVSPPATVKQGQGFRGGRLQAGK